MGKVGSDGYRRLYGTVAVVGGVAHRFSVAESTWPRVVRWRLLQGLIRCWGSRILRTVVGLLLLHDPG